MKSIPLAQALVIALRDLGIEQVFGVSGANIEHIHDALYLHGQDKIHSVLCKSESGAAFMADGYARYSDTIGVCCATSGGGMMNLAVGVAESRASGTPVLALVGCPPAALVGHGAFQDAGGGPHQVDALGLWRSVSKYAVQLDAGEFWQQLRCALREALSGHPGPATLLISRDQMTTPVPEKPLDWPTRLQDLRDCVDIDEHSFATLQKCIGASKQPLIIAGSTLLENDYLESFSHMTGIPVATTLEAPSAFDQTHARYIGIVGVAGHTGAHEYLRQADLIIALGTTLDIMTRAPFDAILGEKKLWVIHTNTSSLPSVKNIFRLTTSAGRVIKELCDTEIHKDLHSRLHFDHIKLSIAKNHPPTRVQTKTPGASAQQLSTHSALQAIQPFMHETDILLFDAGNCAAAASHYLRLPRHCRSSIALGMGGMGYAICAAIGAQLRQPDKRTVVICGDGAFLISGMEIHTAIEQQLPILWIIFNDAQHGMCTSRQRHFFDSRLTTAQYARPDFSALVKGLAGDGKLWSRQARQASQIDEFMDEYYALPAALPGVLELHITAEEVPPFYPMVNSETSNTNEMIQHIVA